MKSSHAHLTLNQRLMLLLAFFAASMVFLYGTSRWLANRINQDVVLPNFENQILTGHKIALKSLVETEVQILAHRLQPAKNRKEQIAILTAEIDPLRFFDDHSGYFYAYDLAGYRVDVPINKSANGQNCLDLKDPKGVPIVREIINAVHQGGGFVAYSFEKEGHGVQPKLSYSARIPGTDFLIGAGVYIDDVEAERAKLAQKVQAESRHYLVFMEVLFIVILGITLAMALMLSKSITNLVRNVADNWLLHTQRISKVGGWAINLKTSEVWFSPEARRIYGLPDDEPVTLPQIQSYALAPSRSRIDAALSALIASRQPYDIEFQIGRRTDGRVVDIHAQAEYHPKESVVLGVVQDITERKQAEDQINLQASALNAAANAIVITDHRGLIKWVNPSFCRLSGYGPDEVIGRNPRINNSGQQPPEFFAALWAQILDGKVWHGELVNRRKDGGLYTEDMTITPVRGADGQITHFIGIKQDVTGRRQIAERLQQSQKMEAIGTLAGGIAHDFNNILCAMLGYCNLLQLDAEGNEAALEDTAEILKAAGRAKDLVQQILTFSRQREQNRQVIHLDTVVKEALKFLRASLTVDIKIKMELAESSPAVLADATQIYQVVINLATNAQHAMAGRPGSLTVTLDAFQPDELFLQAHPEFRPIHYARLSVSDTGCGMDAKTLGRIFEPFFTTKPVGQGTGLGLAVVHGIVQSHDGAITVESQPGQGTTFSLYFPAQTPVEISTEPVAEGLPRGQGQMVLLIDDEPALTAMFDRMLRRLNYRTTSSHNAREALGWFRQNPAQFGLVLTDLTMPELNGLEVARQIHALRPELPVVLMSGFSASLTSDHLHAAGICDLLEKPVSLPAMAGLLHRVLAGQVQAGG